MTYGMMTQKDYQTMDRTIEMVVTYFPETEIKTLEIGVNSGNTSRGIRDYLARKGVKHHHIGIDNQHDFEMASPFEDCEFIIGSSVDVAYKVKDESQHFVLIDGNHNLFFTIADFLAYKDKVLPGGFVLFHDTSPHINPLQDFQGLGDPKDPDFCIACRKGVKCMGLLDGFYPGWRLIFDEYDEFGIIGGLIVVQKI